MQYLQKWKFLDNIILMFYIFTIFFTLIGLTVWSFVNALVWRVKNNKAICYARSQCIICNHKLWFFDLIPIVSWFYLHWRCRYCDRRISIKYPLNELLFWLWFFIISYFFLISWNINDLSLFWFEALVNFDFIKFLIELSVFSILMTISIYDVLYLEIMDILIIPAAFIVLLLNFSIYWFTNFNDWMFWALIIYSFFYIQIFIPSALYAIKNKNKNIIVKSIISYFIFPIWMLCRVFISEKKLSKISFFNYSDDKHDNDIQAWVWWWDLRVWIFMWLLLWVKLWLIALFVWYLIWALFWIMLKIYWYAKWKNIREVPLIPFLSAWIIIAIYYWNEIFASLFM